jgi:hypothetical protein
MEFKLGMLIKAYHSGIHEVITLPGVAQTVGYKQVYTNEGKPFKGKTYVCHTDYCRPVDEEFVREEILKHALAISQLGALVGM